MLLLHYAIFDGFADAYMISPIGKVEQTFQCCSDSEVDSELCAPSEDTVIAHSLSLTTGVSPMAQHSILLVVCSSITKMDSF